MTTSSARIHYKNDNPYQFDPFYIGNCSGFNILLYKVSLLYHIQLTISKLHPFSQKLTTIELHLLFQINKYKTISSFSIAPTIKQLLKLPAATSIMSNSGMAQKSTTRQNLALIDTTNPAKQVDSASDNSGKIDQYYCHGF